jgi:heme-degrading monooxygenase HmoA
LRDEHPLRGDAVIISFTRSLPTPEHAGEIDSFLRDFLPRLEREQPGVVAAYHFTVPDSGESTTIIVWESDEARLAYREGELIREAVAQEERLGLTSTREAYPLSYPR